jgi:hypothetical protein
VTERGDWSPVTIAALRQGDIEGVGWTFAVVWYAALAFFLVKDPGSACMIVPLAVVGLLPVTMAISARRARVRYGGATLEVLGPPSPGGRLEGIVEIPHAIAAEAWIRLTLVAMLDRGASTNDTVLWQTQAFVTPPPSDPGRIPVKVDIPAEPTATDAGGRIYWRLKVYAERGSRGLDVAFEMAPFPGVVTPPRRP